MARSDASVPDEQRMYGVTGATGVLGRLVTKNLDALGVDRSSFAGDIRDRVALRAWLQKHAPATIIHLAARVPVDEVDRAPLDAFSINVEGTIKLLTTLAELGQSPWVFVASTSHVYASSQDPLRETDPLQPQNTYAETKLLAEMAARFVCRCGEMRLCIGRIFSFHHDTQRPPFLRPTIVQRLQRHNRLEPFLVRNGYDVRDLSDADDIARTIVRLSMLRITGTINIASGTGTRIVDFVQQLAGSGIQVVAEQLRPPTCLVADVTKLRAALHA